MVYAKQTDEHPVSRVVSLQHDPQVGGDSDWVSLTSQHGRVTWAQDALVPLGGKRMMSSRPVPYSPHDEKSLIILLPPPPKKGKGRP